MFRNTKLYKQQVQVDLPVQMLTMGITLLNRCLPC